MQLNVAMISSIFYPSIGGAQTLILSLSQRLKERGIGVMVITRHHAGLAHYEEVGGIPTYRVGQGDSSEAAAAISYMLGALRVLYVQRHRYDIMHCHLMISPMTIGLLARPLVRKPLVINPHAPGPIGDVELLTYHRPLGRSRLAAARRWGDAFVSISRDIRQELCDAGVEESKLWDIPNGVDPAQFSPADPALRAALRATLGLPEAPLAIYTGRLAPEKGLDVLCAAWPQLLCRVPDARLLIVGDGELRAMLEQQAREAGVAERVIFTGPTNDVAAYLRAADAFVLPSRTEGLPMALLEAMSCGLPIVASAVGGMMQVIENGVTGRLVLAEDPRALAEGLHEVLTAPGAQHWGERARQQIASTYSLDAVTDRYIQMYETLLHTSSKRPTIVEQRQPAPVERTVR